MKSKFYINHKKAKKLLQTARWQLADDSIPVEIVVPVLAAARRALLIAVEVGGDGDNAHKMWDDPIDASSRENCIAAAEDLEKALVDTRQKYLASHAKKLERLGSSCANVAQIVLCVIAAITLGAGVYQVLSRPPADSGLHATYFSNVGFQGHPFMDVARDLHFNWSKKPPAQFNTHRWFSARWEGCIHIGPEPMALLAETTENSFEVRIDDESVLAMAATAALNSNTKDVLNSMISPFLAPGVHRIVIESERNRVPAQHRIRLQQKNGKVVPIAAVSLIPPGGNDRFNCQLPEDTSSEIDREQVANAVITF